MMSKKNSFRDVEKLSAYLDGELSRGDITRLESRLDSEPKLRALLDNLRHTRSLLRHLPARRAPRNFRLTPRMVGRRPPLPRAYPILRLASAVAALLLFFTFALNFVVPLTAQPRLAMAPSYGVGGVPTTEAPRPQLGGGCEGQRCPTEAFSAEMNAASPTEAPAAPLSQDQDLSQPTPEAPMQKAPAIEQPLSQSAAPEVRPTVPISWQITLAVFLVLSGLTAFSLRQITIHKWRAKTK
jgi:hypothetical protein